MKLIKELKEIIMRKELKILPGNLAYSFFLSLIPIVSLIFYFTTTLNLPNDIIQNFLVETFPKGVVELIQPVLSTQMTLDTFIPLCLSIVVATNGCSAIIITSNTIYKLCTFLVPVAWFPGCTMRAQSQVCRVSPLGN